MLKRRVARRLLAGLLLLAYLGLSYQGAVSPLLSLAGSLCILMIGRALWPASWKDRLGLAIRARHLLLAFVVALVLVFVFTQVVRAVAGSQTILYQSPFQRFGLLYSGYLHTLGGTLNEEMVLGALLLYTLQRKFSGTHPLWIAALTAAAFSLLHLIFYGWIVPLENSAWLTAGTLFVLFAIGLLRNTAILRAGHIAFAWGLHLSINLAGLWGLYIGRMGKELNEAEIFNAILGSQGLVLFSVIVLPLCAFLLSRVPRLQSPPVPAGP